MSVVEFEWVPDPAIMAERINRVAAGLENRLEPMAAAGAELNADIRERFETETAPDGTPWPDLAWSTQLWHGKSPRGETLKDTGELYRAATSSDAVIVSNDAVFYKTPLLPHFGLAHDMGLPDRKNPLPQREFLGMSDESEAVIELNFFEWFERNIDLFVTSTGRVGRRHAIQGTGGVGFVSRESSGLPPLP